MKCSFASLKEESSYYALLSGEYPRLSREELVAILDVESDWYRLLGFAGGLAFYEARLGDAGIVARRAGYVREVGLLLYATEARAECLRELAEAAGSYLADRYGGEAVRVEARLFGPYGYGFSESDAKRVFLETLSELGVRLSPTGGRTLSVIVSEGVASAGLRIASSESKGFELRSPGKRPFFKPGPLSPRLSRALVNLSRLRRGHVYADPFCGTGGFAIEACMLGASRILCGDISWEMVRGSKLNLEEYCGEGLWAVSAWNAASLPLPPDSIDSIATDPPYGRSTTTAGLSYRGLVSSFLKRAVEAVRSGGYIVYAGPVGADPRGIAVNSGLRIHSYLEMYVHGGLTRAVVVGSVG